MALRPLGAHRIEIKCPKSMLFGNIMCWCNVRFVENCHRQLKSSNHVKTAKITGSNPDYQIANDSESTLMLLLV